MSESEKPKKSIKSQRKIAVASKKRIQKLLFFPKLSTKPRIWQTSKAQKLSQLPTINPKQNPKFHLFFTQPVIKAGKKSNKTL